MQVPDCCIRSFEPAQVNVKPLTVRLAPRATLKIFVCGSVLTFKIVVVFFGYEVTEPVTVGCERTKTPTNPVIGPLIDKPVVWVPGNRTIIKPWPEPS